MNNYNRKKDWNDRYLNKDTPWEDGEVSPEMVQLFSHYIEQGSTILEIGCGLGTNAVWLSSAGYRYTGLDISDEAIKNAKEKLNEEGLEGKFVVNDIFEASFEEKFDVIFDRGCLHSFTDERDRNDFAEKLCELLKPGGFWINISGNKDNPDKEGAVEKYGFPRLKASDIIGSVEDKFQIHYMARCIYGSSDEHTKFLGWACVFQKR